METIHNLDEATRLFCNELAKRGVTLDHLEKNIKPGNTRIFTRSYEVYHLKFTRTPFRPDSEKQGAARDLHLKLHYAIHSFEYFFASHLSENDKGTMIGIDEDLMLDLLHFSGQGYRTYVITILEQGLILWMQASNFYEFVMRYDTFMKFPRSGVPVCYVPTGYFIAWNVPIERFPMLKGD